MTHCTCQGNLDDTNQIYYGRRVGGSSARYEHRTPPVSFGPPTDRTRALLVLDMDGDGSPDIIVANDGQPNRIYYGNPSSSSATVSDGYRPSCDYSRAPTNN